MNTEGYAILGGYVDEDAVASAEGRAALLDSSIDGDETHESVDLDSSSSDHELAKAEDRALKKKYARLMDADANEFVPAAKVTTVSKSAIGELVVSTNYDELQGDDSTQAVVHMARGAMQHHSTVWRTARLVIQMQRHEAETVNFRSLDAFDAEFNDLRLQATPAAEEIAADNGPMESLNSDESEDSLVEKVYAMK